MNITIWGQAILVSLLFFEESCNEGLFNFLNRKPRHPAKLYPSIPLLTFLYCNSSPEFTSPPSLSTTQAAPYILCNSLLPRLKTPPCPHNRGLRICPHQSPASCPSVVHHCPPVSVPLFAKSPRDPSGRKHSGLWECRPICHSFAKSLWDSYDRSSVLMWEPNDKITRA